MYILGLNAYHGDSSAALLKDGRIVAATEEERFKRIKHWAGFPTEAIRYCLEAEGITIDDIDHITISRDPKANTYEKVKHVLKGRVEFGKLLKRLANLARVSSLMDTLARELGVQPGSVRATMHNVEHHRAHMASAFFASDFDEAAILSIDGFGDFSSSMIGVGRGNQIEVLDSVIFPHSLGVFYETFTRWLGFPKYGDEYKVMGLSPYGETNYMDQVRDVIRPLDNGLFELNEKYFIHPRKGIAQTWENCAPSVPNLLSDYFVEKFGQPRSKDEPLTDYHRDVAASVQRVTEEIIFHMMNHLQKRTGLRRICITGGCAQNSVANGKVRLNTDFREVYIPSAGHDAGTSIGSALYLFNQLLKNDRVDPVRTSFFGISFTDDQIRKILADHNLEAERCDDEHLYDHTADLLHQGKVLGWFQGRAEFGPRALGNRSILVDPGRKDAKDLLNQKIKRRESFRPFAPSILRSHVNEFFEQDDDVLFMEKVFQIRPEKRDRLPAVTHVDGSGRLQTVHEDVSPRYHALIKRFGEKSGYPIVLNTSFNENEPIVNRPEEALDCYLRTEMDALILGNYVLERKQSVK